MKKAISINDIFRKEHDGGYTKNARLYQDILRFMIERKSQSGKITNHFQHWELANWLMTHNVEFSNSFKDPSTRTYTRYNKIENTQRRTKDKLRDLVNLQLVKIVGKTKQSKGTGLIDLYEYTLPGYLIALLIEATSKVTSETISGTIERIFGLIDACTIINDSRSLLFINKFLKNCHNEGGFLSIIEFFMEVILHAHILYNGRELLLLFLGFRNSLNWILANPQIFRKTLDELDEEEKKIILLQFKLEIEGNHNKNYLREDLVARELNLMIAKELDLSTNQDYSNSIMIPGMSWENMRIHNIGNYSKVTIPSFCETCNVIYINLISN